MSRDNLPGKDGTDASWWRQIPTRKLGLAIALPLFLISGCGGAPTEQTPEPGDESTSESDESKDGQASTHVDEQTSGSSDESTTPLDEASTSVEETNSDSDTQSDTTDSLIPSSAPVVERSFAFRGIELKWPAVQGAHHYRVLRKAGSQTDYLVMPGREGFVDTLAYLQIPVLVYDWDTRYAVEACNDSETLCLRSDPTEPVRQEDVPHFTGYVKPSTPLPNMFFGSSLALSANGEVMVIGQPMESTRHDTYGFVKTLEFETAWPEKNIQRWYSGATLLPEGHEQLQMMGRDTVAVSADGNLAAFGLSRRTSDPGHIYAFRRTKGRWNQVYWYQSSPGSSFGRTFAMSGDGNTIVAPTSELNHDDTKRRVYIYKYDKDYGEHGAYKPADPAYVEYPSTKTSFMTAVAISHDGSRFVIGSRSNRDVHIFDEVKGAGESTSFKQTVLPRPWNYSAEANFAEAVALSADGKTIAVSAPLEDAEFYGVSAPKPPDTTIREHEDLGAVYTYHEDSTGAWVEDGYIKPHESHRGLNALNFGTTLALTADGTMLVVGSPKSQRAQAGCYEPGDSVAREGGGEVATFKRGANYTWVQARRVYASNNGVGDEFGSTLAVSGDGSMLIVGAPFEDGEIRTYDAFGITKENEPHNDSEYRLGRGAVYAF